MSHTMNPDAILAVERGPHEHVQYIGTQRGGPKPIVLYTCLDCRGTFSEQSLTAMRVADHKHLFAACVCAVCVLLGAAIVLGAWLTQ